MELELGERFWNSRRASISIVCSWTASGATIRRPRSAFPIPSERKTASSSWCNLASRVGRRVHGYVRVALATGCGPGRCCRAGSFLPKILDVHREAAAPAVGLQRCGIREHLCRPLPSVVNDVNLDRFPSVLTNHLVGTAREDEKHGAAAMDAREGAGLSGCQMAAHPHVLSAIPTKCLTAVQPDYLFPSPGFFFWATWMFFSEGVEEWCRSLSAAK